MKYYHDIKNIQYRNRNLKLFTIESPNSEQGFGIICVDNFPVPIFDLCLKQTKRFRKMQGLFRFPELRSNSEKATHLSQLRLKTDPYEVKKPTHMSGMSCIIQKSSTPSPLPPPPPGQQYRRDGQEISPFARLLYLIPLTSVRLNTS